MAIRHEVVEKFRGLDLGDHGEYPAIEYCRTGVLFEITPDNGAVKPRQGYAHWSASEAAAEYKQLYVHSDSYLLARRSTTLAAIDTGGNEDYTTTVADEFLHAVRIGTPSASFSYIADRTSAVQQFSGSAFTAGTALATVDGVGSRAMPIAYYLGVTESSNRLVAAGTTSSGGPNGASSSTSHVWFSDPGAPTTWDTDNFVQLTPGDGEDIVGCVSWGGQVFVFKRTKMFVFYGESTDADGNPIFNYRVVSLGHDAEIHTPSDENGNATVTTGPEGVYYIGPSGVWVTQGGEPVSVSDPQLRNYRYGANPNLYTGEWGQSKFPGIHYHLGKLFIPLEPDGTTVGVRFPDTVVYDTYNNIWSGGDARVRGYVTWKCGGDEPLLFSGGCDLDSTGRYIVRWSGDATKYTTDAGDAIGARYTSGYDDFGSPFEKTITQVDVWGTGALTDFRVFADFETRNVGSALTIETDSAATTTSINVTKAVFRKAIFGTYFAFKLEGATFRVDRLVFHIREDRPPGRSTELES